MSGQNVTLHGRNHLSGGSDPIPGLEVSPRFDAFYDAVIDLAATRDLRGYWRLGEGGFGPYADTSGYLEGGGGNPSPMTRFNDTVDMTDIADGALPDVDDDGAVQFNSSTGLDSDYLEALNHWGTGTNNPFDGSVAISGLTVAGWVKPLASASTFDGGIFTMLGDTGTLQGYVLGVAWPARTVFYQRHTTRLTGPVLEADEWVFAVSVHDATSDRIYLNGALVATGPSIDPVPNTNIEPKIGLWNHSDVGVLYGAVDEVSVWFDALSDSEVALLAASGGQATDEGVRSVINTVAAYTAQAGDVVLATGTFTVTLPTAVGISGEDITIKNVGGGTITVGRTSSQTIDGAASNDSLAAQEARTYMSDGAGWQIIGGYL